MLAFTDCELFSNDSSVQLDCLLARNVFTEEINKKGKREATNR